MLSKSLSQFSVDGQRCVPSLFFDLRPNYGRDNEDNGDLLHYPYHSLVLGQTMVGIMKIMATSFKMSYIQCP